MKAAIYARYSTDKQSESSIADQVRVCERLAERHGFKVIAQFSDAAISGGTIERPGYQRLLAAARRHEFDVIVAEDTSRLWRLLAEQAPRLAELADLGIHVVTHDLDTRQESAGVMSAVTGAMSEQYRKEIGRRTRRGLEGLARAGRSVGGRAYGYTSESTSKGQSRSVQPEEAAIVRRIFALFADGASARTIATTLNREGIDSPGSRWKRTQRRGGKWLASAIAGNMSRGTGILNNEAYVGRVIWNRHHWIRSAANSSKRRCAQNPRAQWIVREDESLRIVSDELWERVKLRQREQSAHIGARVRAGLSRLSAKSTGRPPKHLLSGILKCAQCGASLIASGTSYACSSRINGGASACASTVRVPRRAAEEALLTGVQAKLLSPQAISAARRASRERIREAQKRPAVSRDQMAEAEARVQHLVEAIASGGLHRSPALALSLREAEGTLAALQAQATQCSGEQIDVLMPQFSADYRRLVRNLAESIGKAPSDAGRMKLRRLLPAVTVEADEQEIRFWNEQGRAEAALSRIAGESTARNYGSGGRI